MKRTFLSIFLALAMCLSLLPTAALALPNPASETVNYIDADNNPQSAACFPVAGSDRDVSWDGSWYFVNGNVTINGTVNVTGEVRLILCNGATLTVTGGLKGTSDAKLLIYGQSTGTNAGKLNVSGDAGNANSSAILMSGSGSALLEVNGGIVTAELGSAADKNIYAISVSGNLTVNGGELKATGGKETLNENETTTNSRIGIYVFKNMTVAGGKVTAIGGAVNHTAEDNYGCNSTGLSVTGSLTVSGGTVTATGGTVTAAVSSTYTGSVESRGIYARGNIEVGTNGTVHAAGGAVTVTNGPAADCSCLSSGIYLYNTSSNPNLTVTGGTVTAKAGAVTTPGAGTSCGVYSNRTGTVTIKDEAALNAEGGTVPENVYSVSYDVLLPGNLTVSDDGTVQKNAGGGAVKVMIGQSLTSDDGTILLAKGSRIYDSISADSKDRFNALLASGCGYFKEDGTTKFTDNEITEQDNNTFKMSAGSGIDQYILIKEDLAAVKYLDENGVEKSCVFYTQLNNPSSPGGWYVFKGSTSFDSRLIFSNTVNFILCDGATLTLNAGLSGNTNATLNIYAQSTGADVGKMNVTGAVQVPGKNVYAAINMNSCTLVINGGKITATANQSDVDNTGTYVQNLTVNGGTLEAGGTNPENSTGRNTYGIYVTSNMTVSGGTVTATAGEAAQDSLGIYVMGNLTVSGKGKLNATGGDALFSCGIYTAGNNLTMSGGELTATGSAAGVSCGIRIQNPCATTVTGGTLKAMGGTATMSGTDSEHCGSFGIYTNSGGDFTVDGGKLIAKAGTTTITGQIMNGYSIGICSASNEPHSITVKDRGELTAEGNTVNKNTPENQEIPAFILDANSTGIIAPTYTIAVQNGGKLTATSGNSTGSYGAASYGISCKEMTVADNGTEVKATSGNSDYTESSNQYFSNNSESSGIKLTSKLTVSGGTVTAKHGTAAGEYGNVKSYDIDNTMEVSGGKVQSAADGAAVLVCADSADGSVSVSGGTMKLAADSVMTQVSVSNGVKLLDLVNAGYAYQKTSDSTFAAARSANELTGGVKVAQCTTHSTENSICDYCGTDFTPASSPEPDPEPTPSNPGSSSSGSSNPTVSSETTSTPDGSTVKTETKKDGTVVETVKSPDGSTTKTETKTEVKKDGTTVETKKETVTGKDGSSSTTEIKTETKADGSSTETKTETAKSPDGTKTETKTETKTDENGAASTTEVKKTTASDGSSSTTTTVTDENGSTTTSNVSVSSKAAKNAQKSGEAVTLPVEVSAGKRGESNTTIQVDLPANSGPLTVELPVSNVTPGTVAILVNADGSETVVPLSKMTESGIQFTLEKSATIKLVDNSKSFGDVKDSDFFSEAVQWASSRGITDGIGGGQFGPNLSAARAQLVTFLWRAAGCPVVNFVMDFSDVDEAGFYGEAVRWAASLGIVGGYGDGAFGTNDAITREQMAVILYRFAQNAGMDTTQGGMFVREFEDYDSISDYALDAMRWAVNAGIMQGADSKLMPSDTCTRGQIVTMLYRLLGK